jgi:hypothetical protein
MRKIKISFVVMLLLSVVAYAQNVGVNSTGATPNASAKLDLNTGNTFTSPNGKGLLVPNVALTGTGDAVTVNTPATSLFVYNTATAGVSPNNVVPGFYYWNGVKWVAFEGPGSNNWALLGNAGTTVGTNFLGTTDNNDLQFNANNKRSGLIDIANYQAFYGYQAGLNTLAAGTYNSFFGAYSGLNTTGLGNSFFGAQSGQTNTSGATNTAMGYYALIFNNTGSNNSAFGAQALYNATGSGNTAIGINAGFTVTTGANNTALGYYAMNNPTTAITGSHNTAVGESSGIGLTTGDHNSFFGYASSMSAGTLTNATGVGAYSYPAASNVLVLGSIAGINAAAASAHVGIGTNTPVDALGIKVPAGSAINCITADVSAGNGTGNALYANSTGLPSYSTIFGLNTPNNNGTGFDITLSNHTFGASINLSAANCNYSFAMTGEVTVDWAEPSAGVIGLNSALGVWGALGYRNIAGTNNYGGYFSTATAFGAGRMSNTSSSNNLSGIGIAAYGDLFGGWVRGTTYGMAVKGDRVSLYVDGKTVVNQPIMEVTRTSNNQTMVNYTSVSTTAVLQLNGIAKMENGVAVVLLDEQTLSQFINTEELTIIATPSGQTNGVYTELRGRELAIKENNNGTSNTKVNWIIIGQRNIQNNTLPDEVKNTNFDANLESFMHNENDKTSQGTGLYWNGTTLSTGASHAFKTKH